MSLSGETLKALKRCKAEQAAMRLQVGPEWQNNDLVFTTGFGRPLGNNMRRAWERLLRVADGGKGDLGAWGTEPEKPRSGPTAERPFEPRFSMYVLRHTRLTLMVDAGIPLSIVSKHARHKKVAITVQFYVHSEVADTKRAAEESFTRLLASAAS